jgi:hypothetical protein
MPPIMGPYGDWVSDLFPIPYLYEHNNPTRSIPMDIAYTYKTLVGGVIPTAGYPILTDLVKDMLFLWNSPAFY